MDFGIYAGDFFYNVAGTVRRGTVCNQNVDIGINFFARGKNSFYNLFDIIPLAICGDIYNKPHVEFFLRSSMSDSTIILTRSLKLVCGSQPSTFLALAASPIKKSTSAGLNNSLEILTYFSQLSMPTEPNASFANSATV